MKRYRAWTRRTLRASLAILALAALFNYAVDPLQQYRASTFYRTYYEKPRYLNPGLARTHAYDTAILGSSMMHNFIPSEIDKALGVKSIKLSMDAASAREISLLLRLVLRRPQTKNVIIGIDFPAFAGAPDRLRYGADTFPFHLYDDNRLNDYRYLLSIDTLQFSVRALEANWLGVRARKLDPDLYKYFGHNHAFGREVVLKKWRDANMFPEPPDYYALHNLARSFDVNLLAHIKAHPRVRFILLRPPVSLLMWKNAPKPVFRNALLFKEYIFNATRDLPNVELYDFQDAAEITANLDNYMDPGHYSPEINRFMVECIRTGRYRVTPENFHPRLAAFRRMVETWQIPED
ncbi:hypothetical protein G3N55_06105 [Dissulfurirhabdus thermomarina]|uniref:DUF1574 domain-containing protein n=1 Tax=Dissulfurirhabdus thermomarina TaxID=1765737 RepID=A0A6N9TRN0_DISTH|nr:hypothetical protein [Dissulfurirhabdus thermomarina]NDY42414.1 hypothetical protein [Dissulfurirhabdus thermomarina]NMX23816.1 hypothetical protein [Dissulfurirhabdus thermomarina]